MINIDRCPSLLAEGFNTYSPKAAKSLFNGHKVNPILDFDLDELSSGQETERAIHRISVSSMSE